MNTLPARWTLSTWMLVFALLDQVTKWLARTLLTPHQPFVIIPKVFQLTIAYNTGAAFSMLNQQPQLLTLITSLIFGLLLLYGLGRSRFLPGEVAAFSLILGGALGNLTDRFLWGKVTDFLDVTVIHYPIFNVADMFIFIGVLILMYVHLKPYPETPAMKPQPDNAPQPKLSVGRPQNVKPDEPA
ncbi:MAG TPA: signal peptidase II [Oculatellaceae cyanobacterium]|jgi:signal peptidase II